MTSGGSRWTRAALASVSVSALVAGIGGRAEAAPPSTWTGFYVGGYAGGVWGRTDFATNAPCTESGLQRYFCSTNSPDTLPNGAAVGAAGTGSASSTGFTGGAQAGHNWQVGGAVVGIETDFGAFGVRTSRTGMGVYPATTTSGPAGTPFTIGTSANADWLYTLRGRVGATFSNVLIFATGGLALTELTAASSFSDASPSFPPGAATTSASRSKLAAGFVVGGGAEWMFARHWTAKFEYLYVDFGSVTSNMVVSPPRSGYAQAISTNADVSASIARFGVNYRY